MPVNEKQIGVSDGTAADTCPLCSQGHTLFGKGHINSIYRERTHKGKQRPCLCPDYYTAKCRLTRTRSGQVCDRNARHSYMTPILLQPSLTKVSTFVYDTLPSPTEHVSTFVYDIRASPALRNNARDAAYRSATRMLLGWTIVGPMDTNRKSAAISHLIDTGEIQANRWKPFESK